MFPQLADLEMLAIGAYSPLLGYMNASDCVEVTERMQLANGTVWSIPVTLAVPEAQARTLKVSDTLALQDTRGVCVAEVCVEEVFERDPAAEAQQVFGTQDMAHPGVAQLVARGRWCVAGPVQVYTPQAVQVPEGAPAWTPTEVRTTLDARGWERVVGFQTRNPIHRAHEYIIKCALEICDGLLLHPLVGFTKGDDIPADVRLRCYHALIGAALPNDRVLLSQLAAPMRYAGPREAVHHAIIRQNYGCTHFIVGRDHAGLGSYYGTYDAQKIFARLPHGEGGLRIEPMMFEHSFFCKACGQMGTPKTCPHPGEHHVVLSGTKVREMLKRGERPPEEFSRPEVADILIAWAQAQ